MQHILDVYEIFAGIKWVNKLPAVPFYDEAINASTMI